MELCWRNISSCRAAKASVGEWLMRSSSWAAGIEFASRAENVRLDGQDLIVVQAKASRLGMYLLGQALFSRLLIEDRFAPKSVRTVALCGFDDAVLRPLAVRFDIEVVVDDLAGC